MTGTIVRYEEFFETGDLELEEDAPLYRYLSTEDFLLLLSSQKLRLQRVTRWDDWREGIRHELKRVQSQDHELAARKLNEYFGLCWSSQKEDKRLFNDEANHKAANDEIAKFGSPWCLRQCFCPAR